MATEEAAVDPDERREAMEKERERRADEQRHLQQLDFNDQGQLSRDFIESMIDTSVLQSGTIGLCQQYLSRQWIFANLTEAEQHDIKWKLQVAEFKILGSHPPQESVIQGPLRAVLYDDTDENLTSLSQRERLEVQGLIDSIAYAVTSRGREGFEREALNTAVRESRTRRDDGEDDDSGGRFGLF